MILSDLGWSSLITHYSCNFFLRALQYLVALIQLFFKITSLCLIRLDSLTLFDNLSQLEQDFFVVLETLLSSFKNLLQMDWQQFNLEIWVFKSSLKLTLMVFYNFLRFFKEHCELCFIRIFVKLSCSQLLEKTHRHLLLYVDIVFIFKFLVSVLHSCRHYCQSTFSSLG